MDQGMLDQFGKLNTTLEKLGEAQTKVDTGLATGLATIGNKLDTKLAELNEAPKVNPEDIKTAEELKAEEAAKLEQAGVVGGITQFEIWDIPVGQALVGGFTAVFASELIDGFLVKQGDMIKGVVKLVGAGAAIKWGPRLLGSTGSKALAILLAYDGIRSLIPIDTWAKRGAGAVSGVIPGGGLGGFKPNVAGEKPGGNGKKAVADYYEALKGGAR